MAKKRVKQEKQEKELKNPFTVRFGDEDQEDFEELCRRFRNSEFDYFSPFVVQLLSRALNPDPSGEKAMRESLSVLHDLIRSLRERVDELDKRTKSLRQTVAKSTTMLLIKVANMDADKARQYVQDQLRE
jgi:hypothetical protein